MQFPFVSLLIKNIGTVVQATPAEARRVPGKNMKDLPCMADAWIIVEGNTIHSLGFMKDLPAGSDGGHIIDARGRCVFPSWCDSHTHIVYAGSREQEFADRLKGLTYEEVAVRGGGILNSVKKLRQASEDELLESALQRLEEMMRWGTGAVEIKSGYGLDTESELKMLRVIRRIKENTPLAVRSTFLGAHAVPAEYKGRKKDYIDLLIKEMLPAIASEKLADYCDVFCERNYFSQEESEQILEEASSYGLIPKVHANQLSRSGGVQAGVNSKAASVDHLEYVGEEEIACLLGSDTMPTLLPGAQWFLQLPHPPARAMIDSGLPVAIATDFNPGSCPSGNMPLMISLACVQYGMSPEEAIHAATINSAYAMGLSATHGSIATGKQANLFITKEIPGYSFLPYSFGINLIETIILNGKVIQS